MNELEKDIRKKVEQILRDYYDFKVAVSIGNDYIMPKMTASYGQESVKNKDLPILHEFEELLKHTDLEESEQEKKMRELHELLRKIRPEILHFDSSTERAAFAHMDSDFERRMKEKQTYIEMVDRALNCLGNEERQIIQLQYLNSVDKRLSTERIAEAICIPRKKVFQHKKIALQTLARVMNII